MKFDIPGCRKYRHKLFERLERVSEVELNFQLVQIFEVGGKGCKMVGIKPMPGGGLRNKVSSFTE